MEERKKKNGPWITNELREFAVGRHASVKDEFMLPREKSTAATKWNTKVTKIHAILSSCIARVLGLEENLLSSPRSVCEPCFIKHDSRQISRKRFCAIATEDRMEHQFIFQQFTVGFLSSLSKLVFHRSEVRLPVPPMSFSWYCSRTRKSRLARRTPGRIAELRKPHLEDSRKWSSSSRRKNSSVLIVDRTACSFKFFAGRRGSVRFE